MNPEILDMLSYAVVAIMAIGIMFTTALCICLVPLIADYCEHLRGKLKNLLPRSENEEGRG